MTDLQIDCPYRAKIGSSLSKKYLYVIAGKGGGRSLYAFHRLHTSFIVSLIGLNSMPTAFLIFELS